MNRTIPYLSRQISIMLLFLLTSHLSVEAAVFDDGDSLSTAPKIALVLGGGGAKGAAHVGALKVIEEAGIQPDIIVGTSIGAIVGGLYSIGYRAADLDELFRSQQWLELFTREAIEGNAIKSMLDSLVSLRLPQAEADSTRIPFACIASDLPTISEVVLDDDSLARNMRASMSIPGLFKKVKFDGYVLLDGGLLNNLPVDVARQMGADIVIAVDLTVNHHDDVDDDDDDDDFGLSEIFDISKVSGVIGWLLNRPDFKKYRENSHAADIYINPVLEGYSATSFSAKSILEMIGIGEEEAQKHFTILRSFANSRTF
ncbi:MAG: patatin-like phospholipase family protein [Prevotella sp.]|nr:patatin-like phospholipase family protein [Prevotella sp.]